MSKIVREVEAVLFAGSRRMSVTDILQYVESDESSVLSALEKLKGEYEKSESSLSLLREDDLWKLSLKDEYLPFAEKLMPSTELPKAIIETLAMIAWKNPILQSDLVKLRSAVVYDHIAELEKLKLVHRMKKGRSYVVKVTDKFYNYFDIPQEQAQSLLGDYEEPREEDVVGEQSHIFNKGDTFDESNAEKEKRILEEIRNNKIDPEAIIRSDKDFLRNFDRRLEEIESRSFDADQTLKSVERDDVEFGKQSLSLKSEEDQEGSSESQIDSADTISEASKIEAENDLVESGNFKGDDVVIPAPEDVDEISIKDEIENEKDSN